MLERYTKAESTILCRFLPLLVFSATSVLAQNPQTSGVAEICELLGNKLSSVGVRECLDLNLADTGARTAQGRALVYKEYPPLGDKPPHARVLLIGGIHGDEYASFSVMIKWMKILDRHHSGLFHWHIAPSVNIDGLLKRPATRTNDNRVDLNRNMASKDWDSTANAYWQSRAGGDARRNPGKQALSESESRWLSEHIDAFKPDVIVSLHSPYGLVDYDGPAAIKPPSRLGPLPFRDLPTFPGSLGRYAGEDLRIPTLTIELASSRYMPADRDLRDMWVDLVRWLRLNIPQRSP